MTDQKLTKEQEAFLEECLLEFSDRYTDADLEYKQVADGGIPPPPIMYPWYGRPKLTAYRNRDRGDRSNYRDRSDYRDRSNYRDRHDHRDRHGNNYRDDKHDNRRHNSYERYKPY